jgi:hypothetical protein
MQSSPRGLGYKSKRKVEKFKNPAIFWWLAGTYCLNMVEIWQLSHIFFTKILVTLAHIFTKILCISRNGFCFIFVTKWQNLSFLFFLIYLKRKKTSIQASVLETGIVPKKESRKTEKQPSYLEHTLPLIRAFELTPQLFPIPALPLHKQTP